MPLSISRPPFDWLGLESSSSRGGVRKRKWAINRQLKLEVVTPVVSWVPCILSHSCLSLVKKPSSNCLPFLSEAEVRDQTETFMLWVALYAVCPWKGEREKEEHQCVRETVIGCPSHAPIQGPGPQPRHMPWLGIELATLWFAGWCPIHWTTPARANEI